MGLLRTLFIIAIIYLAIRFIARYIFPLLVKSAADKMQQDMMSKMDEILKRQQEQEQKKEGEITIKKNSNRRKNDDGEYVDYEEVK